MPELPEAETIARGLHEALVGHLLHKPVIKRRDIVRAGLRASRNAAFARCVERVYRRGKRVVILLDGGATIVFALGMTGRLIVESASAEPARHTHLRIPYGDDSAELRFCDPRRFGGVWFSQEGVGGVRSGLAGLGYEPLEVGLRRFRAILARPRQIKALLLDQHVIAGLGNIYVDEALHRAALHPLAKASQLDTDDAKRLLNAIRSILRSAIRHRGTTLSDYRDATGLRGGFQDRHRVYNRTGKPCKRCGVPIQRIVVAGRSTHVCQNCQTIRE
jgi:formamidopyrimidine-DNA glycosylase